MRPKTVVNWIIIIIIIYSHKNNSMQDTVVAFYTTQTNALGAEFN